MTEKEFKKDWVGRRSLFVKVMFALGISSMKVSKNRLTINYKLRNFNPWHPLSYVVMVPISVVSVFWYGIPETFTQLKRMFTYH